MKIAIVTQNYPPLVNGQSTFAASIASGLAETGHAVLVVCPSPVPYDTAARRRGVRIERLAGIPLTRRQPPVPLAVRPDRRMAQLLESFQPDVVHLQDHYPLCRAAARAAREREIGVVATNHFLPRNLTAHVPLPNPLRGVVEPALWRNVRSVFESADAVTAPTETAAGLLLRHHVCAAATAISCGVDLERFRPLGPAERRAARAAFGLPLEGPIALYVGRLDSDKRVDVLVRAMGQVHDDRLRLALAGSGGQEVALRRLRDALGLRGRIHLLGHVADECLPALFGCADVFAMPGDAELQSVATLEALATGLPVIAADSAALPELVRPRVNGALFTVGDLAELAGHLDAFAADPDLARMTDACLAVARQHDRRATVARYAALYADVAARRPVPPARAGGGGSAA